MPRRVKLILIIVVGLIILLIIFGLGVEVGIRKANFSYGWGESYGRIFGEPRRGFFPPAPGRDNFMNPYGNAGTVLKVDANNNTLVIRGSDNNEKTAVIDRNAVIRKQDQTITINDIKSGDSVVIIGSPNDSGQIEARFIRIFEPQNRLNNQMNPSTSTNK